jgi:hypothetical protein
VNLARRLHHWRRDRCAHCGHRFRWRRDARHSFGNNREIFHDPCIGYRTWRTKADERLNILAVVCEVWGISDRDVKGVVEMRTPDNAEGTRLRDQAFRVFYDLANQTRETS